MRLLALETSEFAGSAALFESGKLVAEAILPPETRSAQFLAPAVHQLLAETGWRTTELQRIAVGKGPGSFTGLRVGLTLAKTLAYALHAQLLGVDTLEVIAQRAPADFGKFWAVINAQRQEVFAASFERLTPTAQAATMTHEVALPSPNRLTPTELLPAGQFMRRLEPGDALIGPMLNHWQGKLPTQVRVAPPECWAPMASAVGQIAWRLFEQGQSDDPFQLVPEYHRRTAAEEQWDLRQAKG